MLQGLTSKEYEIMKYIWENDEGLTFGEIHAHINGLGKELKRQSVNSFIQHLIEKEYVKAEGEERRKLYYPTVSRKQYNSMMAQNIVEQLFDGSLKKFVTAFSENHLSEKDIQELKAILKKG